MISEEKNDQKATRGLRNIPNAAKILCAAMVSFCLTFAFIMQFAPQANAASQSVRIAKGETDRKLNIGANKTVVVRLPVAARDVLVGNPEIVDAVARTPFTVYLFAKKIGETNVFFFDEEGRQILSLDIDVGRDAAALKSILNRVMPGNRVRVHSVGETVVLTGKVRSQQDAAQASMLAAKYVGDKEKVVNSITIANKQQVLLKVRVIEIQRQILKQLGVDAAGLVRIGNASIGLVSGNPFSVAGQALNGFSNIATGGAAGNGVFGRIAGASSFDGALRLMERDGMVRTLAAPTLTSISGESAKFLAGGEFPVPVNGGDDGITVSFKPFGVGLGFTPVVLSENRINLKISTEVSEISNENQATVGAGGTVDSDGETTTISQNAFVIPSLRVRRAETTVEIGSGGSLVLAGLISERLRQDINGIPGMKDVPVLGTLFRSRDYQRNETELVVMVTPVIVKPVAEGQLATPLDRFIDPSDVDTILFGRLNAVYGTDSKAPAGTYHGEIGYIID
ncbi:MAG: type II and III secretion system protein family protein [Hyphomicrobiales bacterium]